MRERRLILFAFYLRQVAGHHLNETMGFVRAAKDAGMAPTVYGRNNCDPAIAEMIPVERLLTAATVPPASAADLLAALPAGAEAFDAAWTHILTGGLDRDDIIIFSHGNPVALFDLTRRLASLSEAERPAVFVTFLGGEFLVPDTGQFHPHVPVHRFIADLLARTPGGERVFYVSPNHLQIGTLTRLFRRRALVLPYYLDYGSPEEQRPGNDRRFTVHFHVTEYGDMERLAVAVAEQLLQAGCDVDFSLRFCRYGNEDRSDLPPMQIPADRVFLTVGGRLPEDHRAARRGAEITVLPFPRIRYHSATSGSFCESVAAGSVIVGPQGTWIANRVEAGVAIGVLFDELTVASVARAANEAFRRRGELVPRARALAEPFRRRESCAAALARMIELAAAPPDMRADCTLGDEIDFSVSLASRHLIGTGWSATEEGFGVWSDGDEASLVFAIAEVPAGPLILEMTATPFVTGGHDELRVHVSSAGNPLADWRFHHVPGQNLQAAKRRLLIPAALAASRPLRLDLAFDRSASPASLGLSTDSRRLGVALHRLSFSTQSSAALI